MSISLEVLIDNDDDGSVVGDFDLGPHIIDLQLRLRFSWYRRIETRGDVVFRCRVRDDGVTAALALGRWVRFKAEGEAIFYGILYDVALDDRGLEYRCTVRTAIQLTRYAGRIPVLTNTTVKAAMQKIFDEVATKIPYEKKPLNKDKIYAKVGHSKVGDKYIVGPPPMTVEGSTHRTITYFDLLSYQDSSRDLDTYFNALEALARFEFGWLFTDMTNGKPAVKSNRLNYHLNESAMNTAVEISFSASDDVFRRKSKFHIAPSGFIGTVSTRNLVNGVTVFYRQNLQVQPGLTVFREPASVQGARVRLVSLSHIEYQEQPSIRLSATVEGINLVLTVNNSSSSAITIPVVNVVGSVIAVEGVEVMEVNTGYTRDAYNMGILGDNRDWAADMMGYLARQSISGEAYESIHFNARNFPEALDPTMGALVKVIDSTLHQFYMVVGLDLDFDGSDLFGAIYLHPQMFEPPAGGPVIF